MSAASTSGEVVALCGGVGGAKLALGLYRVLGPDRLTLVVNTADDFEHLGLNVSPDIDTVVYTLAGLADAERGWGRVGETWQFMGALRDLSGDSWFNLGDRDLAMHVLRTEWLRRGGTLAAFTADIASSLGITARILPMTNGAVRTIVATDEGDLPFQHYFVRRRCEPAVRGVRFDGAALSAPTPELLDVLSRPLRAIVICPSNPFLSIDPILSVPGLRAALAKHPAPVVAVSPIIGGEAVKGPTAKMMAELGIAATTQSIAAHYRSLVSGLVIDRVDAADRERVDVSSIATNTLMRSIEDRARLARDVLAFCDTLARDSHAADAKAEVR
jgi:LPPG:FO 2-phospho-L-lactate transferase